MSPTDFKALDRVFNPKTVAVIGDKARTGFSWLKSMQTFKGTLYSVQIDEQEVPGIEALGIKNCKSVRDIPQPVDYAVIAVPRKVAVPVVEECARAKVGGVSLFTSGFAELDEEGAALQKTLGTIARKNGMVLIGPNCMGLYRPELGVRFNVDQPTGERGDIGFASQSGTHCLHFSTLAWAHDLRTHSAVSFGNAAALESTDYLEYFAQTPEIKVIGAYIEGVRDGARFLRTLKQVARRKPVIVWKGGQTIAGSRATASHTGSLATPNNVWNAVMKQSGAVRVECLDEMVDVMKMFLRVRPLQGNRLGLIAMTGGQSVVMTDAFGNEGLEVPLLTEGTYRELASFFNVIGGSYKNPLDASYHFRDVPVIRRLLQVLGEDDNLDAIALEVSAMTMDKRWHSSEEFKAGYLETLAWFKAKYKKPFFAIVTASYLERQALDMRDIIQGAGVPCFSTFERAARAYRRALDYYRFRNGQ